MFSNRFKPGVFTRAAVAGVLAVGLVPVSAFAAESADGGVGSLIAEMADSEVHALDAVASTGNTDLLKVTSSSDDGYSSLSSAAMPTSFDLRDRNIVTPVKDQSPWGTCWAFGTLAAAETSILNKLGLTYGEYNLDLSELQVAYFSRTLLPEGSGSQAGEGGTTIDNYPLLNTGGTSYMAGSIFASGTGPISENLAPYKNKENNTSSYRDLFGNDMAEIKKKTDPTFDVEAPMCYSMEGDWSVDEALRFQQTYQLEDANLLPSPCTLLTDEMGVNVVGYEYNEEGTAAIKQQLLEGNAVQIGFAADTYMPGKTSDPKYINTDTWAHYTWEATTSNHSVAIVGWDDDYSKDNFLDGHKPEHNGAWIVKNSWGSTTEDFPNNGGGWGNEGYFYISYYDRSLSDPETFEFDVDDEVSNSTLVTDSYSYMPVSRLSSVSTNDQVSMANIFTAEQDQKIDSLSTETGSTFMTVDFDVYLLDDDSVEPTDGKHVVHKSETFDYAGFHRVDLNNGIIMKEGQRYSVVVTQRTVDGKYQVLQPGSLSKYGAEQNKIKSYCVGVVNKGESLLHSSAGWTDWTDYIVELRAQMKKACEMAGLPDYSEWLDYDNVPIRAYGSLYATPTFSDVSDDDWFAPAVAKVADAGLMRGYEGGDEFGVGKSLTRAELATILWRDANPADAEAYDRSAANATAMDDVADGAFYTAAANWAVASGVIEGFEMPDGSREFQPDRAVTFEEAVKMIARYHAAMHGADVEGDEAALGGFADAGSVSEWARPYMAWAVESGLVGGYPTGDGYEIRPADATPRERAARIVSNALEAGVLD